MFNFFKKPKKETECFQSIDEQSKEKLPIEIQSDWLLQNGWISKPYDKNKKTILVMDDREEIISSIIDDLKSLDCSDNFSIDDYNMLTVHTKMAGFDVLEIIETATEIEINYALLDIVLGGKKTIDGVRVMLDGVDVAIKLMDKFPSIEILFFSGCIIDSSDDPSHFKNKFDNYTGDDLNNYIMAKDISFDDELKKLSEFFNGY